MGNLLKILPCFNEKGKFFPLTRAEAVQTKRGTTVDEELDEINNSMVQNTESISLLNQSIEQRYTKKETDDKFATNNTSWTQVTDNAIIDFQKNGKNIIASIRVTKDIVNGATLTGAVPVNMRPKTNQVATQIAYHPTLTKFGRVSVTITTNGMIVVGCLDNNAQFVGVEWCVLYTL